MSETAQIEDNAIIINNERPWLKCLCRKCGREYRSENELDTDGEGCCPEHQKEQERIAQTINEKIRMQGPKHRGGGLDAEEIKRHYRKEVDTQSKTIL